MTSCASAKPALMDIAQAAIIFRVKRFFMVVSSKDGLKVQGMNMQIQLAL
jgi:hypothetical protein